MRFKDKPLTTADFQRMAAERAGGRGKGAASAASNKFNAVPVVVDGIRHDSKHEGNCISYLMQLEQGGYIEKLRRQKCELMFALEVNGVRIADYEADARFTCVRPCELSTLNGQVRLEPDQEYVLDAKSAPTRKKSDYVMKKKLLLALHGHRILEV